MFETLVATHVCTVIVDVQPETSSFICEYGKRFPSDDLSEVLCVAASIPS